MSSGGGVFTPSSRPSWPIDTLLSGPSGGISGAAWLGRLAGRTNLITFDMGGTSTDVSLVADGKEQNSRTYRVIDGLPIRSTAVDVHTIGAGGSSIAWLDGRHPARRPASAGARPGPACYGAGGTEPTVTDANMSSAESTENISSAAPSHRPPPLR